MNTPTSKPSARGSRSATLEKAAHSVGVFFATFEAITIHSVLSERVSMGAIQALVVMGGALSFLVWRVRPAEARRRVVSRVAVSVSVAAVILAVVLSGKAAEVRGVDPASWPLLQTVLLLVFQLGWALTFWLTVAKKQRGQVRYVPAAIGGVVLIGGGLLAGGGGVSAGNDSNAANAVAGGGVVFKQFATAEDFAFAKETRRVGEESGSAFAHYHTGRQPLIGLSFDVRDWFGRARVSNLTGIFEDGDESDGAHRIEARPGYVVASVEIQADDHVNAIRVEFAPFDGEFLEPDDWYWSEWVGGYEGHGPTTRLDGGTDLVVGLRGASGMVLNSLSLLTARPSGSNSDQ